MEEIIEIKQNTKVELIINKSKFIAYSFIVRKVEDVQQILNKLKSEHMSATHICYAYKIMGGQEKCSDDGEPQNTAGKPMLEHLKKNNIQNVLVAVVRYFGGIKLGAGGLIRAYAKSTSDVINASQLVTKQKCIKLCFNVNFSQYKALSNINNIQGVKDCEINYAEFVEYELYILEEYCLEIKTKIKNLLSQDISFETDNNIYYL